MNLKPIFLFIHIFFAAPLVFGQLPEDELPEQKDTGKSDHINIELFGGSVIFFFPTEFDGVYSTGNKFGPSLSPSFGINFLYMISKSKRLGLGVSLAYHRYKSHLQKRDSINTTISPSYYFTTNYNESFKIENSLLAVDIYLLYVINSTGPTKFFASAGFLNNVAFADLKTIVSEYSSTTTGIRNGNIPITESESGSRELIPLTGSWAAISTAIGLKKGKSRLKLSYAIPTDVYSNPSRNKRFRINFWGLNYCYHLH